MVRDGLDYILPDHRDFSLVPTFGLTPSSVQGLPDSFSIYDGREIPNQNIFDNRFTPPIFPMPFGCVGETGAFDSGIQDGKIYRPDVPYLGTVPFGTDTGRDIRTLLKAIIDNDLLVTAEGEKGPRRKAYFNCYGSGGISDFNAARMGLWINQAEKRGVWAGTFWYSEFDSPDHNGSLPLPSFDIKRASRHCYLITGWRTLHGIVELELISWQGNEYGKAGLVYMSEEKYDALMAQPYTGAFTVTKVGSNAPIPVGTQAIIDHLIYWVRNLLGV